MFQSSVKFVAQYAQYLAQYRLLRLAPEADIWNWRLDFLLR